MKRLFRLTPLGKAHHEVKNYLKEKTDSEQFGKYESALNHYRHLKTVQLVLKLFLYAGVVTSVATTLGLPQAYFIQKIASFIGLSAIFTLYAATSYFTMTRRENYHVQREILVSEASNQ